ncbi:MAG: hypothetical protein ABSF63_02860 [Candidatus Bathyarchaeia archaeon]|jgi:RNase P subunit RPR2
MDADLEIGSNATDCFECHKPLVWVTRSKRLIQGRNVDELHFRCDSCKREYRFREGMLREMKIERDPVAEELAMQEAEIDTVRNRRCSRCGGPLDQFLSTLRDRHENKILKPTSNPGHCAFPFHGTT